MPEEDRANPKYSGYYFVFLDSDIGDGLRQLQDGRASGSFRNTVPADGPLAWAG